MNAALSRRLAAVTGLALAAAAALWWLGTARLAIDQGSDASRGAADALLALWLVRAIAPAMLSIRVAALGGWQAGAAVALGLIAPAWPVVMLAWSASTAPLMKVALAEFVLLATGLALPLVGCGLRRVLRPAALAEATGTLAGAALAAALWFTRGAWARALS